MKLKSARIRGFRSIQDVTVPNIGDLNILIGKNNSGKTTVLLAIDAFFRCIAKGNLVSVEPPIGLAIDYFRPRRTEPIQIELSFEMNSAEQERLRSDIVAEAPQMENAVEAIPVNLRTNIRLSVQGDPKPFAYVSNIVFAPDHIVTDKGFSIFSVSPAAADELWAKYSFKQQAQRESADVKDFLNYFSDKDWQSIRDRADSSRGLLTYYTRRFTAETLEKVQLLVFQSESYDEFKKSLITLTEKTERDAQKAISEPLKAPIGTFSGQGNAIPSYVQKLLDELSQLKVIYLQERREPIGVEEATRLLRLKTQRGGTKVLDAIQQTVEGLLGVRIDAFTGLQERSTAEIDVDEFLAEVNGSGIREALRVILDFEFKKPSISLVEEPEIYLHPALQLSMMRYLTSVSSRSQVLMTTHSTSFLDIADMQNVYLVSRTTATNIQKLTLEDAELQLPKELGLRVSSLFLYDRLIFVEGPTDEKIIREFASKLGVNLSKIGVGFIHLGGIHNFTYFAAEQTLSFLLKRQIKLWFILDRDEKDLEDITKLTNKCAGRASLFVLSKRELENYLVVPRALIDFIELKHSLSGQNFSADTNPSEDKISRALDDAAESLKQWTIEKRVVSILGKPISPAPRSLFEGDLPPGPTKIVESFTAAINSLQQAKESVQSIFEEQRKEVEGRWTNYKLDLVPGDLLLDSVCRVFGTRFNKDVDGERLAALLHDSEISPDVRKFIEGIPQ